MFTKRRLTIRFLSVGLVLGMLFSGCIGSIAFGQSLNDTKIILTSRFILWDETEKMIDPQFTIHILHFNSSVNQSYYQIRINEIEFVNNGTFQDYTSVNVILNNTEIINHLTVRINNYTVYNAYNIIVISGISQTNVEYSVSEWLISLNPLEWRNKEWNIFFAVIVASLICVPLALRYAKIWRKKKGVTEIQ